MHLIFEISCRPQIVILIFQNRKRSHAQVITLELFRFHVVFPMISLGIEMVTPNTESVGPST